MVMLIKLLPGQKFIIWLLLLSGLLVGTPPARSDFHGPPAIELTELSGGTLRQSSPSVHQSKPASKRQTVVGKTSQKSPIIAFRLGRGKQYVVILGGMHGDEPSSARVAEAFAASLEREPPPAGVSVVIIPEVNPDGLKAGTRSNSVGVDINRNFPSKTWRPGSKESRYYPGEKPMSEPETRASVKLIKKWRPALLISIHAPLQCVNWDGPAENVSAAMAQASGFSLCRDIGYETPGSLGSYAGLDLDIPTVTLELGDNLTSQEVTNQGLRALRAALDFMSSAPFVTKPRRK